MRLTRSGDGLMGKGGFGFAIAGCGTDDAVVL
jgi:hypothetical protein